MADTSAASNNHKHRITPYQDKQLKGRVLATFVAGHLVYERERGVYDGVCGGPLKRSWHGLALEEGEQEL